MGQPSQNYNQYPHNQVQANPAYYHQSNNPNQLNYPNLWFYNIFICFIDKLIKIENIYIKN